MLGETGRNFAAGMSGGIAYVYNTDGEFEKKCNKGLVSLEELDEKDAASLKDMLEKHLKYTGSDIAERILNDFENELGKFVKVIPNDYKKVMTVLESELEKGADRKDALLTAFESVTGKKVETA